MSASSHMPLILLSPQITYSTFIYMDDEGSNAERKHSLALASLINWALRKLQFLSMNVFQNIMNNTKSPLLLGKTALKSNNSML